LRLDDLSPVNTGDAEFGDNLFSVTAPRIRRLQSPVWTGL